jgi:hypothetical protein
MFSEIAATFPNGSAKIGKCSRAEYVPPLAIIVALHWSKKQELEQKIGVKKTAEVGFPTFRVGR